MVFIGVVDGRKRRGRFLLWVAAALVWNLGVGECQADEGEDEDTELHIGKGGRDGHLTLVEEANDAVTMVDKRCCHGRGLCVNGEGAQAS